MIESDIEGIVLKSFKYSNSSLIGEVFTSKYGLGKYILKGINSKKNTHKAILFRPPQIISFTAYFKNNRDINFISKIDSAYLYESFHRNIKKGTLALFYIEMFRHVVYDGDIHKELYQFFKNTLLYLDNGEFKSLQIIIFLYNLSSHIGIEPPQPTESSGKYFDMLDADYNSTLSMHSYTLNESHTSILKRFLSDRSHSLTYNNMERKVLFEFFMKYYSLRLDNFNGLHSPEIIKKVLSS